MQARKQSSETNNDRHRLEIVAPSANLAHSALTVNAQDRSKIALVWESADGRREVFSFFEIENLSNKIANVLAALGASVGDRVFTLLNRTPELYATIPAVLKIGAAIAVLFPDFGPEAIRQRIEDSGTCEAQRIGPFEVENALLSHPAIAESAAVGMADAVTTEHVKAFIVLRRDFTASGKLAQEIAAHVRAQLSPLATPREIEFCTDLPKTRSGKIQRNQLRRKGNFDKEKVFTIE